MPELCKTSLVDFENAKPQNMMGTRAGLTKEFNISVKLRLKDPLLLNFMGVVTSKRVNTWIREEPLTLWNLLYCKTPEGQPHLSLASDALLALKSEVKKINPQLIEHVEARRKAHLNRNRKRLKKIDPNTF